MVESRLQRILDECLLPRKENVFSGPNALCGSFSSKNQLCRLLGFITEKEYKEIERIRKVRNQFAHVLNELSFDSNPICDYCMKFQADTPEDLKEERKYRALFVNSVVLTSLSLWYRPEYIKKAGVIKSVEWEYRL